MDSVSTLNLYLKESSSFTGAICAKGSINLNGHKLYVNGKEYKSGTASTGEAMEITVSSSSGAPDGNKPEGNPPAKPD